MSRTEFLRLVRLLTAQEAAHAGTVHRQLWRWIAGAVGAVIFLAFLPVLSVGGVIVLTSLGMGGANAGGAVMSGLLIMLGLVLWGTILRLLSTRPSVPAGLELNRREAPGLFAELDALCAKTGSAPFDGVLLSQFCNAHVTTGPRTGVTV